MKLGALDRLEDGVRVVGVLLLLELEPLPHVLSIERSKNVAVEEMRRHVGRRRIGLDGEICDNEEENGSVHARSGKEEDRPRP